MSMADSNEFGEKIYTGEAKWFEFTKPSSDKLQHRS